MKDGSSVIATGDDEVERAVNIEARFTCHARGGMGRRCNESLLIPDSISLFCIVSSARFERLGVELGARKRGWGATPCSRLAPVSTS
jgi:hypothetical protein